MTLGVKLEKVHFQIVKTFEDFGKTCLSLRNLFSTHWIKLKKKSFKVEGDIFEIFKTVLRLKILIERLEQHFS